MIKEKEISPKNHSNWFALYTLCKHAGPEQTITLSSKEFGKYLNLSQQTASRRINDLEELGWIKRTREWKTQKIMITKEGTDVIHAMYENMKEILKNVFPLRFFLTQF